jgi:DNA-binding transcriptional ArsR family regulator
MTLVHRLTRFRRNRIPETEVFQLLSNPRRCAALRRLSASPGAVPLRELAESVARAEADVSPAPRATYETVYVSLHQTHLPRLHELGIVEYDRERRQVRALDRVREVNAYMDAVTRHGVTWGEYYRALGVGGLFAVVASSSGLPLLSVLSPATWAAGFLAAFTLSTTYQLWTHRFAVLRAVVG